MEVTETFTYTELRRRLAGALGRDDVPASTLSRWMQALKYPRGKAGQRRLWDGEDLIFISSYAQAVSWGYLHGDAYDYAKNQLEKLRSQSHARI